MLIPKCILKPLTKIISRTPSRYAIQGAQFTRKGSKCTAAATDGKRLLVCEWDDKDHSKEYPDIGQPDKQKDFSVVLSSDVMLDASKLPPKQSSKKIIQEWVQLFLKDKVWTFGATNLDHPRYLLCSPLDGSFPKYTDIIPDPSKMQSNGSGVGLDTNLFSELLTCATLCAAREKPILRVRLSKPNKPARIDANGDVVTVIGVIMPVNLV